MEREFLQSIRVGEQPLPEEIVEAIWDAHGKAMEAARQTGAAWEEKYNQAVQAHRQELASQRLESTMQMAVSKAGGKNLKAIAALLDLEKLAASEDLSGAMEAAVEQLKQENSYLFEAAQTPPPYARGTGARETAPYTQPATLAGALREKYERK